MTIKERLAITEEMGHQKDWYEEARKQTLTTLPEFLNKLTTYYEHDYGTICHAIAASALAAGKAINKSDQGGISGFQAGCIMWEFIRNWMQLEGPLSLVQFRDMLYPQYHDKFQKIISFETMEYLVSEARRLLAEKDAHTINKAVLAHWKFISDGGVPFGYTVTVEEK